MEDLKDLQDGYMECANNRLIALTMHSIKLGQAKAQIRTYREKLKKADSLDMAFFYTQQVNNWMSIKMYYEDFIDMDIESAMCFIR